MKQLLLPTLLSSLTITAMMSGTAAHAADADLNYLVVNRPPSQSEPYNPYVAEDLLVTLTSSNSYWTDALFRCDQLGVGTNAHAYHFTSSRQGTFAPPDPDAVFEDPLVFGSLAAGAYNLWGKASGVTQSGYSATSWYAPTPGYSITIN